MRTNWLRSQRRKAKHGKYYSKHLIVGLPSWHDSVKSPKTPELSQKPQGVQPKPDPKK